MVINYRIQGTEKGFTILDRTLFPFWAFFTRLFAVVYLIICNEFVESQHGWLR
jgi:hypothetical protein